MFTEQEKKNIRERVIYESEIRKSIEGPKRRKSWLNSNIAILIIGSVITGLLVPIFQYSHKSIEWRRQNQFESYKFNITQKEQFLKEFITLSALLSEAYEISKNNDPKITSKKEYINNINELQKRRFHQNSKINYFVIFINNNKIRELFREHIVKQLFLISSLKKLSLKAYDNTSLTKTEKKMWPDINHKVSEINSLYERITDMVYLEIKRINYENKTLHML